MNLNSVQTKVGNESKVNDGATEKMISEILSIFNVKSKKKRIRNKVYKKAISLSNVSETFLNEKQRNDLATESFAVFISKREKEIELVNERPVFEDNKTEEQTLRSMPVTFLLKLGKQFIGNELVVRNYYKVENELYYKNRELLESTLTNEVTNLPVASQKDFWSLVEKQTKKAKG